MTQTEQRPREVVDQLQASMGGAATVLMAHLGDRLGLYRALAEQGPATPGELGSRTGFAERYLREWLSQQAVAGLVTYDPASGRFTLPAEHAGFLGAGDPLTSFTGAFAVLAGLFHDIDRLAGDFASADGIAWSEHESIVHDGTAGFFGTAYAASLVREWIPALGLERTLSEGARVADVGAGEGVSTMLLAEAYPRSVFTAVEPHPASREAARRRAVEAGVADRVRFESADATSYQGGPYDVIWFFDVIHDLGDPVAAAEHARRSLADGGVVALVEPRAENTLAENIAGSPGSVMHYTASTFLCVPHALSEGGHATLGGQAGGRRLAAVLREAGLTRVERVNVTPLHAVYAARP